MNKKVIFVILGVAAAGVLIYFLVRKKASPPVNGSLPGPGGLKEGESTKTEADKFTKVLKDESKGSAILQTTAKGKYKTGDSVNVYSPVYKGIYKVWYVYAKNPSVDNVYIDAKYVRDSSGQMMLKV